MILNKNIKLIYKKMEPNAAGTTTAVTQTAMCKMKLGEALAHKITSGTLKIILTRI